MWARGHISMTDQVPEASSSWEWSYPVDLVLPPVSQSVVVFRSHTWWLYCVGRK